MKPLEGLRPLLACPTYGPYEEHCDKELRVAIMSTAKLGVEWAGDASTIRMGWSQARNTSAQLLLETNGTGIMWVDSDMRQKPDDMVRLLAQVKRNDLDFVTAVYHQRGEPYDPCFYTWLPNRKLFAAPLDYEPDKFTAFDGCGFGFVYTSRRLIEMIAKSEYFDTMKGWFPDERQQTGWGEDLSFSRLAMLCGVRCWVDSGIIVGHSGDPYVQYRPDAKYRAEHIKRRQVAPPKDAKDEWKWGVRPWHKVK